MATGNYERCSGGEPQIRVAGFGDYQRQTAAQRYGYPASIPGVRQRRSYLTNLSPSGQLAPDNRWAGFGAFGLPNEATNAPATPRAPRAYEDPSTWGSAVHDTLTAAADLARAARGEPRVSDEEVGTDYSVPPDEESFFSTTGGKVLIFGGIGLAVLGLVFFLKKDKSASAAVKENRRRRNRRKRNRGRGRVPMYYANCA